MSPLTRTSWSVLVATGLLLSTLIGSAAAAPLESEDLDGNGVADTCQSTAVVADPVAVDAAVLLADLDSDGLISVREAAHTDWIGGPNCNHGGYVSSVAAGTDDACDETETPVVETDEAEVEANATECSDEEATQAADDPLPVECNAEETTPQETEPAETVEPNAHGKKVSEVAQSDAVGGKNCNHGGAVSDAAKQAHGNKLGHEAAKAAKAAKHQAKSHGKGHGPL